MNTETHVAEAKAGCLAAEDALLEAYRQHGEDLQARIYKTHGVSVGFEAKKEKHGSSLHLNSKFGSAYLYSGMDVYARVRECEIYGSILPAMSLETAADIVDYFGQEVDFSPKPKWWSIETTDFWSYPYFGSAIEAREVNKMLGDSGHISPLGGHNRALDIEDTPEARETRALSKVIEEMKTGTFSPQWC